MISLCKTWETSETIIVPSMTNDTLLPLSQPDCKGVYGGPAKMPLAVQGVVIKALVHSKMEGGIQGDGEACSSM